MISYSALNTALNTGNLVKVLENPEATLYYAEKDIETCGSNYDIKLKAGEYIAISKDEKTDVWTEWYYNSTKGSYKRCEKAWEKYSPEWMAYWTAIAAQ